VRKIGSFVVLFALWLLLSGIYKPLIVGFGAVSVLVVLLVTHKMDEIDRDQVDIPLNPVRFVSYLFWLLVEIAKANWIVTKTILSPKMPLRQHLFLVPTTQRTDLGQVIFANSITLTPGTISVETMGDQFLVHALTYSPQDDDALGDMDRRVSAVEAVDVAGSN
jgi:multicomponent Na+:H+ antiporter subunit E